MLEYEASLGRTLNLSMETICAYRTDQVTSNNHVLPQLIQAHKNTITPKTGNVLDNRTLYIDTFTEDLNDLLGKYAAEVIFYHVEKLLNISRDQFSDRVEDLEKSLESIFGEDASKFMIVLSENRVTLFVFEVYFCRS